MDNQTAFEEVREHKASAYYAGASRHLWRWVLFLLFLGGLFAAMAVSLISGTQKISGGCLGIPVLTETEMSDFQNYEYFDYSENLRYQDEFAAIDEKYSVLYLSQKIDEDTEYWDLNGDLSIDFPGCRLYFAPDERWEDLRGAVRDGHKFSLLVVNHNDTYMKYDVVFTTLPVISMHGKVLYKDENLIETLSGRLVLWDPVYGRNDTLGVQSSLVRWHIRGGSSFYMPKKSWKLSLKKMDSKSNSEELLGMGSDDDWILNSMSMEDSNVRERLFMDLWNEMAAKTEYNYPMSRGEYVEVLVNGRYQGLYFLQRKVDDKYLQLDADSVMVKAKLKDGEMLYEFFSPSGRTVPDEIRDPYYMDMDCSQLCLENFVDISLYLQLFSAMDNTVWKNMYYVFEMRDGDTEISMIPWDTDIAMGSAWDAEEGFVYNYDYSLGFMVYRQEMEQMKRLYPDLDEKLSVRWFELREDILSLEHITEYLDRYVTVLENSGAVARDENKWGLFYEGEDTVDKFYRFVEERLEMLDEYYNQ